jgi:hypothetical protein
MITDTILLSKCEIVRSVRVGIKYRVESFFGVTAFVGVMMESSNRGINKGNNLSPGMLLSYSLEPE